MIVADHPWFALHYWNGQELVSHFDTVEEHEVLARFIPKRQPLLRMLKKERAEA
jgi:Icc protein